MIIKSKFVRSFFNALLVVLIVSIWTLFAPVQFGGQASYIIVAGASMEPSLHQGDLVIAHQDQEYRVGDVVTYQHPLAGPIIHRIVDRQGDQYILQGDNNDWVDSYFPIHSEIIGKLWTYLPESGKTLGRLRNPTLQVALASLIAIGVITTVSNDSGATEQKFNKKKKLKKKRPPQFIREGLDGILFVILVLLLASGLLAFASYSRPETIYVSKELIYELKGEFEYSAEAPPGIYDSPKVETGDPIFRKLTDDLQLHFTFSLVSEALSEAQGNIRFDAEVSDSGGWTRSIEIHPAMDFEGDTISIAGQLSLAEVQSLIDILEEKTGFHRHEYKLKFVPTVIVTSTHAGWELLDSYDPELVFHMDDMQMFLVVSQPGSSRYDQLVQQKMGVLAYSQKEINSLPILGIQIPVRTARSFSTIGIILAIGGLIGIAISWQQASRGGEQAKIAFKYGAKFVEIAKGNFANGHHRIDMVGMEDLAQFAEQSGGVILHEACDNGHHYYVQEGNLIYHFKSSMDITPKKRDGSGSVLSGPTTTENALSPHILENRTASMAIFASATDQHKIDEWEVEDHEDKVKMRRFSHQSITAGIKRHFRHMDEMLDALIQTIRGKDNGS